MPRTYPSRPHAQTYRNTCLCCSKRFRAKKRNMDKCPKCVGKSRRENAQHFRQNSYQLDVALFHKGITSLPDYVAMVAGEGEYSRLMGAVL